MKVIFFCENSYSFGVLEPIMNVLKEKNYDFIWYASKRCIGKFPFKNEKITGNIQDLVNYKSDVIFVPGNEVPHYLRGVKTQVFHGLAGEKKGHFRIRKYFDLYLTQGPYFTKWYKKASLKYKTFKVVETGWPKLDVYGKELHKYDEDKNKLLLDYSANKIVLYAPTFSPSLTSAPFMEEEIKNLSKNKEYLILIKFHDLMALDLIEKYKKIGKEIDNVLFIDERNIIKYLLISDLMVSDTSSVVYEFLLLDKPVITFKNNSKKYYWENSKTYDNLLEKVKDNLINDTFKKERAYIFNNYHPYRDGNSAVRMVEEVEKFISEKGVPEFRKLPLLRRLKMNKIFGKH